MRQCQALQKVLRRDSGPTRKQTMKMESAQAGALGERRQTGLLRVMFIQIMNDGGNSFVVVHERILGEPPPARHPFLAVREAPANDMALLTSTPHCLR